MIPPKAVYLADDLYNYSLPMLAKLEKEIPSMRLRLMGLRLTHLVSMKKDAASSNFFGLSRQTSSGDDTPKRKASTIEEDGTEWEVWPDDEFEAAALEEQQTEREEMEVLSQEDQENMLEEANRRRKHGKEILPNPTVAGKPSDGEMLGTSNLWDCPICSKPQPARDRDFNDHIDFCLSRQTIKEVVKDTSTGSVASGQEDVGRTRPLNASLTHEAKRRKFFG